MAVRKVNSEVLEGNREKPTKVEKGKQLVIPPPKFKVAEFHIRGTAPLVMNRFSSREKDKIITTQEMGDHAKKKGKKKDPKDFEKAYENSKHMIGDKYCIPCTAMRIACVNACRLVGFHMTLAKMSIFVESDGNQQDMQPGFLITKGEPERLDMTVRISQGKTDVHARAAFPEWEAKPRIRFDSDQFALEDVTNLVMRVGIQVGLLEGRPFSSSSCGMGWGVFEIVGVRAN